MTKLKINLKEIASESRTFAKEFKQYAKQNKRVFIHKHGNLDAVLMGMDLIMRATVKKWHKNEVIIVDGVKNLKEGHYFLGVVGLKKKVANVYLEKINEDTGYFISMGFDLIP